MNLNTQLSPRSSLRRRSHAQPEESERTLSRAVTSVRAGLRTRYVFHSMDDTEEVAEWLGMIGLEEYIPVFRAHSVTGNTLVSLNSVELRKTLGITNLSDRRHILDSITYLAQTLCVETKRDIPEDGRILTHLSNERIFLVWVRFTIILHTVAVVTLRLRNLENSANSSSITSISFLLAALAVFALLYGTYRYHKMHGMIDNPGKDHAPSRAGLLAPVLIVVCSVVVGIYALMSNSTEEAAMLALMAV